jgi:beta-1,4-mannosyltransferase
MAYEKICLLPAAFGLQWKHVLGLGIIVPVYLSILPFLLLYVFPLSHNKSKRVAVLVLGDVGRSPRMQNHAVSLAKAGWNVDLIGFRGESPPELS